MKLLILALSALLGTFVGLLYDLQMPALALGTLKLSGPALATSLSVSLILASGLIGLMMISMRIDRIATRPNSPIIFEAASVTPRLTMPEPRLIETTSALNPIPMPQRPQNINLSNLELRAER